MDYTGKVCRAPGTTFNLSPLSPVHGRGAYSSLSLLPTLPPFFDLTCCLSLLCGVDYEKQLCVKRTRVPYIASTTLVHIYIINSNAFSLSSTLFSPKNHDSANWRIGGAH
jgi:hypothetical protein